MESLYPLKFRTKYKDKIWGGQKINTILGKNFDNLPNCGETWEISGVEGEVSVVNNGFLEENELNELIEIYMDDLVGGKVYEKFGNQFPLLIKFIDANDVLSIQVHPDDELAAKRHNCSGKTEMWYVLQADEHAEIITGFNTAINKDIFLNHLQSNTISDLLNIEPAKAGDVFFIPAGRIHAIGKGILLTEIQQTSDVTYRIYDWDRTDSNGNKRELHIEQALDAIDFNIYPDYKTNYTPVPNTPNNLVSCPYFSTNLIQFNKAINRDYEAIDSFVIYIVIDGKFDIIYNQKTERCTKGECILIPAELKDIKLNPISESKILEVYIDLNNTK